MVPPINRPYRPTVQAEEALDYNLDGYDPTAVEHPVPKSLSPRRGRRSYEKTPHVTRSKAGSKHDSQYAVPVDGYEKWSSTELADYFELVGLGDYRELIIYHKITGRIAPLLNDNDLKDMGIEIVGDRCRFRNQIHSLSRKARTVERAKVIWEGEEKLFFGCCDGCIGTCCGIFPEDPSTYKLASNYLKVKLVEPMRCGPVGCPCNKKYSINNIDLTHVDDVDVIGVPPPLCQQIFCCADGKDVIDVNTKTDETKVLLVLKRGDGDVVGNMIMNQVEEAQMMERD